MTDSRVASLAALLREWQAKGWDRHERTYPGSAVADGPVNLARWLLARGVQYAPPCECPSDHIGNQWHTPACQKQGAR